MTTAVTPAERGSNGSAAPARLLQLVAEREPTLDQLRRERDDVHMSDAIIEMAANRVRVLVAERNGRIA